MELIRKTKNFSLWLEICEDNGYNTGLIANSSIVHATPASFYANIDSRGKYEENALQLSESNVDYFIGGGKKYFNKREDNRNLVKEMDKIDVVKNFKAYKKSVSERIGFFPSMMNPHQLSMAAPLYWESIWQQPQIYWITVYSLFSDGRGFSDWLGRSRQWHWIYHLWVYRVQWSYCGGTKFCKK